MTLVHKFTTKRGAPSYHPRPGQWVVVDGKFLGIAVEPDHGNFTVACDTITSAPAAPSLGGPAPQSVDLETWRVDLVHTQAEHDAFEADLVARKVTCFEDRSKCHAEARAGTGGHRGACIRAGKTTKAHVLVHVDRISPVVDQQLIPASRRATQHPDWKPRA